MKRLLLILILQNFATGNLRSQSFTVNDLLTLSGVPSKNIGRFMDKKGYALSDSKRNNNALEAGFRLKAKIQKKYVGPARAIDMNLKDDTKYFSLHTTAANEYQDGKSSLIKAGFFYDDKSDIKNEPSMLFQKGNISIRATSEMVEDIQQYNFELQLKKVPSNVKYAEDLLQFDSHELLVSFFGAQNVKKDMYYFSEKELQKCSVLFSGTRYQVVFIWGDENNLNNLSYILVPHVLPTQGAKNVDAIVGNNEWPFQNGIYPGMAIKELLRLNEVDFDIYGNTSELAYMVKPVGNGRIDFKKTAVMLSCSSCDDIKMFNQQEVSALDVAKKDIPMYVNDVIIYPTHN